MNEAKVMGIDACDMVHIDDVINLYCQSNNRRLLNVTFFEEKGMKYMLLITSDNEHDIVIPITTNMPKATQLPPEVNIIPL